MRSMKSRMAVVSSPSFVPLRVAVQCARASTMSANTRHPACIDPLSPMMNWYPSDRNGPTTLGDVTFLTCEQSEQREQSEQPEQPEQREQREQPEQREQSEQFVQPEQFVQFVQPEQFVFVASAARAASSEPYLSTEHLLPLSSEIHCICFSPVVSKPKRLLDVRRCARQVKA